MTVYLNRTKATKGYPVGSIIPWPGAQTDIPSGWLPCSSNLSLRVEQYPALFKCIGNIYGGNVGETFKLPRMNDGTSAAMDIFKGHFYFLQDKGPANAPEKDNINDDLFWSQVGGALAGDAPSSIQTNFTSTVDVEGVLENVDPTTGGSLELTGKYSAFDLIEGEFTQVILPASRKLSDRHWNVHIHGSTIEGVNTTNAYRTTGRGANDCRGGKLFDDFFCDLTAECTAVTRAIPLNLRGTNMAGMGGSGGAAVGGNIRAGGGSFGICPGGETSSVCYDPQGADGFTGGDMWAHRGGTKYFWSSLAKPAGGNADKSFNQVTPHTHGVLEYEFSSKYLRVLNPGLVTDIRLNTVAINNATGLNYGTITVNTATPTLQMTYIIRAY